MRNRVSWLAFGHLTREGFGHVDSRPNRSAAALASAMQTPKPVELSGHVWVDNDLDSVREANERALAGVRVSLWKEVSPGQFQDTGHSTITDSTPRLVR